MCPGNNESADKRKSGRTRKGSKWLRSALVESAYAASRTKNTYLSAQFWRLAGRRGKRRAAVAVGHSILVIAYGLRQTLRPILEPENKLSIRLGQRLGGVVPLAVKVVSVDLDRLGLGVGDLETLFVGGCVQFSPYLQAFVGFG